MFKGFVARAFAASGVSYRVYVPLLLFAAAAQTVVSVARVTTSYRIVELDLPVIWIGLTAGTFALFPIFLAVWVGRFIDRGNDALTAWIGSALLAMGCVGLVALSSSKAVLLASTAVMGVGHMFMMASQQMLCVRCADRKNRESVFGNYMVAGSIGQGLGPYIVGWAGGTATIPPTQFLFTVSLIGAFIALVFALAIRPSREIRQKEDGEAVVPVAELLKTPGLVSVLLASVMTVTAQDLIVIYLPLLGAERRIDANAIGVLLTVRAAASMVARFLYARLVLRVGRTPLMITSMLATSFGFACLAVPLPPLLMHMATAVLGFALGIATTLTITTVVELTTARAQGTANSLRIMGNRIGQMALPFAASLVAAATGAAGILVIVAIGLAVSGATVYWRRPGR